MKRIYLSFHYTLIFMCLCLINTLDAQTLSQNGIGSFENATDFSSDWWVADEGIANFSVTNVGTYYGDRHLKVDITSGVPENVRMHNRADSYFNLIAGQEYTVSFYAKGNIGNTLSVNFANQNAAIGIDTVTLSLDEWSFYTVKFTSNVTSNNGRVRLKFMNQGIYEIDELTVREGGFSLWHVSPEGVDSQSDEQGLSPEKPLKSISYAINNAWQPGDIIYVMDGTYRNNNFGTGELNSGSVVYIGKAGTLNGPLVIRNYPGHQPKIEFDGAGGFIIGVGEYLEISGFEIQGPNQKITKEEAEEFRFDQYNYYQGRGIAVWASNGGGHHILFHSNKVYDCPSSGIRINNSDYCILTNNEVFNTTTWSSTGSSAIVLAQSKSYDQDQKIKMRITRNRSYNNVNNIHYYNRNYNCPDPKAYGCPDYPKIIDGSGCYITRNNDRGTGEVDENPNGQYTGMFLFANNVAFGNGINGVVVHKSDNSIVVNNTTYHNGQVPLSEGRQEAAGITVNESNNVRFYNNIAITEFETDYGFKKYNGTNNISGANNILINGKSDIPNMTNFLAVDDPHFTNIEDMEFDIRATSEAINVGVNTNQVNPISGTEISEYFLYNDNQGNPRIYGNSVDIGAYEYQGSGSSSLPFVSSIDNLDGVLSVNSGETITVTVDFDAPAARDVVILFQRDNNPFTTYKSYRETVSAGSGTVTASIQLPSDIPIATNDYQYKAFIAPVGGSNNDAYASMSVKNISVVSPSNARVNSKNDYVANEFQVYPNPTKGEFNFMCHLESQSTVSLKIYDLTSQVVAEYNDLQRNVGAHELQFNVEQSLSNGLYTYLLIINGNERKVHSGKVIVNR